MKKHILASFAAVVAALGMIGLAACGGKGDKKPEGTLSEEEALAMIETFTDAPSAAEGTFVQDFTLEVDSDNASFKSFAKDLRSVTDFSIKFVPGDVYMYAKKTVTDRADGGTVTVTESILAKEDGVYSYATTTTPVTGLAEQTDAAALGEADRLFKNATTETSGWLDSSVFVYTGYDWVQDYIMLGSSSVQASNARYFTYSYEKNAAEGLNVSIENKYVGYTGDAGVVDVGTDDTYTGGTVRVETDGKGCITSFSQTMNNQIDFNITNPPVPLYYTGTRTLTATYDGEIAKKSLSEVNSETGGTEAATSAVTVYENPHCASVETFDFAYPDYSTLNETSAVVTAGNYVAVKVVPETGYEVAVVLVNGKDTSYMNGYWCLMEKAEAGTVYNVAVTVKESGEETGTKGLIVAPDATDVAGIAEIKVGDFDLGTFKTDWETSEVEPGHYVTVEVTCEEGYTLSSVKVNGEKTELFGSQYCYMSPVVAGAEYVVDIETVGCAVVACDPVEGCAIGIYNFNLAAFSGLDKESDVVYVGNWVAVLVTCEEGYEVESVMIYVGDEDSDGTDITKANYGTAYSLFEVKDAHIGVTLKVEVTLRTGVE
ncbi:MAG: hypothetical protein LUD47_02305 [Clostridia bacterium]|nr:hypothetical protein [Clostridia bacterium]